ncbi:hypothetical protein [Nocardia brasiliensis]|uniref:hypothetical protein n=1 Tax=Nocardia brasiliensis TaxID=37326 RepID=UPI0004A77CA4|nr:hypothetical protein [Nocardia brasiliensis]
MSSRQKPRWPEFFPRMKQRGQGRKRPARIVVRNVADGPIWPPVLQIGGCSVDFRRATVTVSTEHGNRQFNRWSGFWEEV